MAHYTLSKAQALAGTNVNWKETPTEHVFKVDLPGLRQQDLKVQVVDGRTLRISGYREKEEVRQTDIWHLVECSSGQFMREFGLPKNVNLDQISATVENGVLTVVLPTVATYGIETGGHDVNTFPATTQGHII